MIEYAIRERSNLIAYGQPIERRRITVQGVVQGVGFRPFVYRLAYEVGVCGWVNNSPHGVVIEAEAPPAALDCLLVRLQSELPPNAAILKLAVETIAATGARTFVIEQSEQSSAKSALILPDLATCPDCLREMRDPTNRRYRYPFTNCTHCGPRFSIIDALPYDRAATTMRGFTMCPACRAEYEDPRDRRFHAQPNACPVCGPQLALWDSEGQVLATRGSALRAAVDALRAGQIVAAKGLGGFHLLVDARNSGAVATLRARKGRYEKPLAVMFPALENIARACIVSSAERALLTAAAAPIVLLRYRGATAEPAIAPEVAPGNPWLGVMLPYTPLHHLLLGDLGFPVVATSGNLSGEPICTDEHEALARLGAIADLFLVHDRPIARHVDDSVAAVVAGKPLMLRRARGYAPLPVELADSGHSLVAVGAQQKNVTALLHHGHVFLSQHLGDMENVGTVDAFKRTLADFQRLYACTPSAIVCDLHPDYAATRYAETSGLPVLAVQHHYAHVLACMAEHNLDAPVLGVAWDGTGLGTDSTIWGGEFLRVHASGFARVAHLRPFPLPGGDAAAREPRRSLLGLLYAYFGDELPRARLDFTAQELRVLLTALDKGINAPLTSSMGRLFDAVAALLGLRQRCAFEGQAAMLLEYAAQGARTNALYPYGLSSLADGDSASGVIDLKPMLNELLNAQDVSQAAAMFHNTLAAIIVDVARQVGVQQVALTGGCFQNRLLLARTIIQLRAAGFSPYWPQCIPPNDGGIAMGQIAAALREVQPCV